MPKCGSQIVLCDIPIRFDTYKGCTHGCKYCFVTRKVDISAPEPDETAASLARFIDGHRTRETQWCDWPIPLHWGGVSDPFQPCERKHRVSRDALRVFADTGHPVVVSTKGALIGEPEYLDLIGRCNAVVQFSLCSPQYDRLEPGAPPFEERLRIAARVAQVATRVIVRVQPYTREIRRDLIAQIPRYAAAGIHGIVVEGLKAFRRLPGMVKLGADYVYPSSLLEQDFRQIRHAAHEAGLRFYSGENRLRAMGDHLCCCGIDGLPGFRGNTANLNHYVHDPEGFAFTPCMESAPAEPFRAMRQDSHFSALLRKHSFAEVMRRYVADPEKRKTLLP